MYDSSTSFSSHSNNIAISSNSRNPKQNIQVGSTRGNPVAGSSSSSNRGNSSQSTRVRNASCSSLANRRTLSQNTNIGSTRRNTISSTSANPSSSMDHRSSSQGIQSTSTTPNDDASSSSINPRRSSQIFPFSHENHVPISGSFSTADVGNSNQSVQSMSTTANRGGSSQDVPPPAVDSDAVASASSSAIRRPVPERHYYDDVDLKYVTISIQCCPQLLNAIIRWKPISKPGNRPRPNYSDLV
jgi:hypothetical protein